MFIITNERVIWIEQVSFLNRTVSECGLWQVEEVWSKTKGLFANIFNYWSIEIQTAWNSSNFLMEAVPNPIWTSRQLHNIINVYRWDNENENSSAVQDKKEKSEMVENIRKRLNPEENEKLKKYLQVWNNEINTSVDDILDK